MRRFPFLALLGLSALSVILLILVARLPSPSTMLQKIKPITTETTVHTTSTELQSEVDTATLALQVAKPEIEISLVKTTSSTEGSMVLTRDVYKAGFERSHPEICPSLGSGLSIMILVSSSPSNVAAREAIRLTWGHFTSRPDIGLAFFLGSTPSELQSTIDTEDTLYKDIIVGNFVDSETNRTLKTLSMLEWFNTYCSSASRLLKTEDDMFINIPNLVDLATEKKTNKTIWGRTMKKLTPHQKKTSKYYLSRKQYSGDLYPDFTSSPAYLMTSDCIAPLLALAPLYPYLRLEDVFVTGLLADKLGIQRVHVEGFYNRYMPPHPCIVKTGLAIHLKHYHEQFDWWRKLLDDSVKCDA